MGRFYAYLAKQFPQDQTRALDAAFQYVFKLREPLFDPFNRWCLEHFVAAAEEPVECFLERFNFPLSLKKCLGERAAAPPFADKVNKIGQSPLLGSELGFLKLNGLWDVCVKLGDLRFHTLQHVLHMLD